MHPLTLHSSSCCAAPAAAQHPGWQPSSTPPVQFHAYKPSCARHTTLQHPAASQPHTSIRAQQAATSYWARRRAPSCAPPSCTLPMQLQGAQALPSATSATRGGAGTQRTAQHEPGCPQLLPRLPPSSPSCTPMPEARAHVPAACSAMPGACSHARHRRLWVHQVVYITQGHGVPSNLGLRQRALHLPVTLVSLLQQGRQLVSVHLQQGAKVWWVRDVWGLCV